MINQILYIFEASGVIVYPHFVAYCSPWIVNNFLGVISLKFLPLPRIAVAYIRTAETSNATDVYTKTIKDEKPTLLNDNCLTFALHIGRGSKTWLQGHGSFLNSNQFSCTRIKDWLLASKIRCRERVVISTSEVLTTLTKIK